jgi:hypothetical protein
MNKNLFILVYYRINMNKYLNYIPVSTFNLSRFHVKNEAVKIDSEN